MLGLSTDQWIAIWIGAALTVVGLLTLLFSGRAGHHAKRAAKAADQTAAIQMASLNIKFGLYLRFSKSALMTAAVAPITLTNSGVNLTIHELRLVRISGVGRRIRSPNSACHVRGAVTLPALVHTGGNLFFDWPGDVPDESPSFNPVFEVTYGFSKDATFKKAITPDMITWV